MAPPSRILIVSVAILGLSPLVSGLLLFGIWPTWMTGGYYEFTVTEAVIVDGHAELSLRYDETIAYGTVVEWSSFPAQDGHSTTGRKDWINDHFPPLRWPRKIKNFHSRIWIGTQEELREETPDPGKFQRRLLIKPGTYRLRCGEWMAYCRETYPDGRVAEGRISALSESDAK